MSTGGIGPKLAIAIERATLGAVRREELRPDIFGDASPSESAKNPPSLPTSTQPPSPGRPA
ncbi:helix-turn-helix domain-containing protein [Acidithiobacillus sp. VAN18-1]|uniref:Helix-turn-helix domain-containing protein n=2 Tax=Igneacidithiobacillus copahuensis TaxID=2724909 RepID=A0AAE3CJW7_9PROT|nr:helix-turn-helix domain-containing protein [Igneacidithiobacillus copahuensis]MBU2795496.1 helix-turn-helix domain-containing protein [Acidithiobacillus sp. VAN18-2]